MLLGMARPLQDTPAGGKQGVRACAKVLDEAKALAFEGQEKVAAGSIGQRKRLF